MKVDLEFNAFEITQLWDVSCKSFLNEQPCRFLEFPYTCKTLTTEQVKKFADNSTMYFTNSYLNAKIIATFFSKHEDNEVLLVSDETDGGWCVIHKTKSIFEEMGEW